MSNPVSRLALATMVQTRLATVPHATVYLGVVDNTPPLLDGSDRVAPYVVLFAGDGSPIDEAPLSADYTGNLNWSFQITCAAGYTTHLLQLLDDVHKQLDGWMPVLAGYQFAPLNPQPGYDAGPVRTDRQVEPPRVFLPCQYVLTAALA